NASFDDYSRRRQAGNDYDLERLLGLRRDGSSHSRQELAGDQVLIYLVQRLLANRSGQGLLEELPPAGGSILTKGTVLLCSDALAADILDGQAIFLIGEYRGRIDRESAA